MVSVGLLSGHGAYLPTRRAISWALIKKAAWILLLSRSRCTCCKVKRQVSVWSRVKTLSLAFASDRPLRSPSHAPLYSCLALGHRQTLTILWARLTGQRAGQILNQNRVLGPGSHLAPFAVWRLRAA